MKKAEFGVTNERQQRSCRRRSIGHGDWNSRLPIDRPMSILFVVFILIIGLPRTGDLCFGQLPTPQIIATQATATQTTATQANVLLGFALIQDISDGVAAAGDTEPVDMETGDAETGETAGSGESITDEAGESDETAPTQKRTMLEMMFTGNLFGVGIVIAILLLSVISTILIVENAISIRRKRLLPPEVVQSLESALALRDTRGAMMICSDVDNHSLVTQVVQAGLERYRSSEFGFAEYRSAVEEAGDHVTGQLYRKVEVLNVIASIAPMLGLTGTVIGMIDAFNTIAANQGVAGPEDLAGGIGQALITTLLGLLVAIPTMVAFSFFRSRIDSLVSEAGTRIERMMLPLGRRKSK